MSAGAGATQIQIRAARLEDAEALARLSEQLGYPATADGIRGRLEKIMRDPSAAVFVAETSSGIAGWIQLLEQHILETGLGAEVAGLVVDARVRRRGVGRRLMERAERWGGERGCEFVNLRSNVTRAAAHAFYESLGYRHIKTQKALRKELPQKK